jgi:uncharacterized protein YqgC (DUF456 family)
MLTTRMEGLLVVALLLIGVGLVGTVVPGLPGMPLVLAGIALFAIGTSFSVIGPLQFAGFVLLGVLGMGLNYLGDLVGAQKFGASRYGLIGAILGLIPGLLLLGPFGVVIGPMIGAVAAEMLAGRDLNQALRSGFGVAVGYICGSLAEVLIALIMTGWFIASTFWLLSRALGGGTI